MEPLIKSGLSIMFLYWKPQFQYLPQGRLYQLLKVAKRDWDLNLALIDQSLGTGKIELALSSGEAVPRRLCTQIFLFVRSRINVPHTHASQCDEQCCKIDQKNWICKLPQIIVGMADCIVNHGSPVDGSLLRRLPGVTWLRKMVHVVFWDEYPRTLGQLFQLKFLQKAQL